MQLETDPDDPGIATSVQTIAEELLSDGTELRPFVRNSLQACVPACPPSRLSDVRGRADSTVIGSLGSPICRLPLEYVKSPRSTVTAPRSLRAHVIAYSATHDLIPLYGVYALLFSDHGITPAATESLFIIWSVTAFVVEIPSGAWADAHAGERCWSSAGRCTRSASPCR